MPANPAPTPVNPYVSPGLPPVQSQQPINPYAAPGYQTVTQPASPPPLATKSKLPIIIFVAVIAVLTLVGIAIWLGGGGQQVASGPKVVLPKGSEINASTLANYKTDELFWGYFKNASMQTGVVTTNFRTQILDPKKPDEKQQSLVKVGYDYKTKKMVMAADSYTSVGGIDYKTRCVDGKYYSRFMGANDTWKLSDPKEFSSDPCETAKFAEYFSDGMNTGGLNDEQATKFMALLRTQPGLFTIDKVAFEDHRGKTYLHFSLDMKPIKTEGKYAGPDLYQGLQWFDYAFLETGLDPNTYPYGRKNTYGNGLQIDYFVDTDAQLPHYVELVDTPFIDDEGHLTSEIGIVSNAALLDYSTSTFDASTANNENIKFDW